MILVLFFMVAIHWQRGYPTRSRRDRNSRLMGLRLSEKKAGGDGKKKSIQTQVLVPTRQENVVCTKIAAASVPATEMASAFVFI